MAKGPETRLQQSIQKSLRKEFKRIWLFKVWGGPFTPAGIPDLVGCVEGLFFAMEIKLPDKRRSKTSDIQDETILDIKKAHGAVAIIRSVDEALTFIRRILADAQ